MRYISLAGGLLVLIICTSVPLSGLDYNNPFTSTMVRHVGLLLLAAPLLAMAIPSDNILRKPLTNLSRLTSRRPAIAWFAGIFTMWLWHLPVLYNLPASAGGILSCSPFLTLPAHAAAAALGSHAATLPAHAAAATATATAAAAATAAHPASLAAISLPTAITALIPLIHTPSLLLAGFIFCWPLVTPYASFRLPALHAILYLASACITCSLAGLLITYAPQGMYRGITTHDQQSGGLIMWVPCCFLYLSASMTLLIRWLSQKEPVNLIHS
ncbi:MAG TPA: cytochrome c oxidase assembly protein [Puia sp.]|nr:cytochrome c oxidase assembly protein [Puia sp.]